MLQVNKRSITVKIGLYIILVLFAVWSLFPVVWVITTSLRPNEGAMTGNHPFDFSPELNNYQSVWTQTGFPHYFINTLVTSVASTALSLILGLLAGYALARFRFRGNNSLAQWILSVRLAPPIAFVVPLFIMFNTLKLIDSSAVLITVYTAFLLPFSIWLFSSFIKEMPREVEEAALIDGCNHWQVVLKVMIPQMWPAIAAVALLNLTAAWNEFLFALILTSSSAVTLPVGITSFIGERGVLWGQITAAAVITMIIPVILSILANRYLVRGMSLGTYK